MKTSPPSPPPTILVPDDHPLDISLIRWVLDAHELPYELQVLAYGDYALYVFDLLAQQEYPWSSTIVLCNLHLPQLDGNELLRHIQALPPGADIRVVAVISSADSRKQEETLALGADSSFGKPYHLTSFIQIGELIKGLVYGSATAGEPPQATVAGMMRRPRAGPRGRGGGWPHQHPPASGTPPRSRWQRGLAWGVVCLGLLIGCVWGVPWLSRRPPLAPTSLQIRSDHVASILPATAVPAVQPTVETRPPLQSQPPAARARGLGAASGGTTPGVPLQPPQASVVRSAAHHGPKAAAQPRAMRAGHQRHVGRRHALPRPAALWYVQAREGTGASTRPRAMVGVNRPGEWSAVLPASQPSWRWVAPEPAPEIERPWSRRLVNDEVGE